MTSTIEKTAGPVRALRWMRLLLHVVQGLLVTTFVYPRVAPRTRARITQSWAKKLLQILNIVLDAHGAVPSADDNKHSKLFVVANHVSWLDIFVINAAQPSRFVAKSEIRDWPLAGWLVEAAGTIFVHRTRRSDTARINREIHDALEVGDTVAIFPEGTTTAGDRLLRFHTSLFEPAVANSADISPAAIGYRNERGEPTSSVAFIGETSFSQSMTNIIGTPRVIAHITFAPVISTHQRNRREVAAEAEAAIARILGVPLSATHHRFDNSKEAPSAESANSG